MTDNVLRFRRDASGQSDAALLLACGGGDNAALEELFTRHGERVCRKVLRLSYVDRGGIDDVLQTTFVQVFRSAKRYTGSATVGTWIVGIAMNVVRHHVNAESRRKGGPSLPTHPPSNTRQPSPDEETAYRQVMVRVDAGFRALPKDLRIVFTLCDLEYMRSADVSRALGIPEGTVWRRLHHGRRRLRRFVDGPPAMSSLFGSLRRVARGCPAGWKLTRAASEGPDKEIRCHLPDCDACARELAALCELLLLAKTAFSDPAPMSEASRNAVSRHLLAVARATSSRRLGRSFRLMTTAVVGFLALFAEVWVARDALRSRLQARGPTAGPQPPLVSIRALDQARFSRIERPPDETVRLDDGSIELQVSGLATRERFRVLTSDAEIEVRGTRCRVTAHDRKLVAVQVWEGQVEVRSSGGGVAVLYPGDEWEAPAAGRVEYAPHSAGGIGAARDDAKHADESKGPRAQPVPSGAEQGGGGLFASAWTLMRKGDFRGAATGFREAEVAARGSPLEEDALYWRAVATARLKNARAADLFTIFITRFPSSPRTSEVRVALGWLRLKDGRRLEAERLFYEALPDSSPQTAASAREGLRRAVE